MYNKYFDIYSDYERYFCMDNEYFISVIKFKGDGFRKVIPIKTNIKVKSYKLLECSKAVRRLFVGDNIRFGDIICKNIINSGADIIAIKTYIFNVKNIDNSKMEGI